MAEPLHSPAQSSMAEPLHSPAQSSMAEPSHSPKQSTILEVQSGYSSVQSATNSVSSDST